MEHTRREGLEFDAAAALAGGHSLYANYAFTRATFQVSGIEPFSIREEAGGENEVQAGDHFPLVPSHTARAGAALALPGGLGLGFDARYTGERWLRGDEANEEAPLDAYAVVDLWTGVRFGNWSLQGMVTNLLDEGYAAFGTFNVNQGAGGAVERFLTPAQPRSFRLVVRRVFGSSRGSRTTSTAASADRSSLRQGCPESRSRSAPRRVRRSRSACLERSGASSPQPTFEAQLARTIPDDEPFAG